MDGHTDRRGFLGTMAAVAGTQAFGTLMPGSVTGPWDLSWIDTLRGKHKQVFAVGAAKAPQALGVVVNYLDGHLEVYGLKHPQINTVVGITTSGYPINATDAMWDKYELGKRGEIKDPATGDWARRNIYLEPIPVPLGKTVSVRALQARGTIFYQCNNALNVVVERLAAATGQAADGIRADLVAGLVPGVKLVPAHTMVLGLLQERGFTYEQIG